MPIDFRVTPECCADVLEFQTVFLRFEWSSFKDGSYDEQRPHWVIEGRTRDGVPAVVEVHQCPHCHESLPEVRVRGETTRQVCRPKPNLAGCFTCGLSLMECRCLPPEYLYEPAQGETPLWRE